jgi:hypothetical protein
MYISAISRKKEKRADRLANIDALLSPASPDCGAAGNIAKLMPSALARLRVWS